MTFSELIQELTFQTSLPKSSVVKVVRQLKETIREAIEVGHKVVIPGLGTFVPHDPPERVLFGGTRKSGGTRKIKFHQSRRGGQMDKYGVAFDDEKTKTAAGTKTCPKCGAILDKATPNYCKNCGTEPFEKKEKK